MDLRRGRHGALEQVLETRPVGGIEAALGDLVAQVTELARRRAQFVAHLAFGGVDQNLDILAHERKGIGRAGIDAHDEDAADADQHQQANRERQGDGQRDAAALFGVDHSFGVFAEHSADMEEGRGG